MTTLAHGISADLLESLGWTLIHFLWQGAALAALFAVGNGVCRQARTRYALAVITLGLMMAAPVITFTELPGQKDPFARYGERGAFAGAGKRLAGVSVTARPSARQQEMPTSQTSTIVWFVEAWFLGVLLLSLRTAGGLFLVERMRRRAVEPVTRQLYEKYLVLQRKMGLARVIRYCQCVELDAPAVLGWFRPVVLLPARALTGLSEEQLAMIIAHELAHIRRLDCFVNLFQIGAETLLFYHPAVWWVSQRIRTEREHCCDDEAVRICGDAVNYARALTLMEEWRTAPSLVMAANRSPLSERVVRLLGLDGAAGRFRVAGLAVGVLCLAGAMLAGNAFLGVAHAALGSRANPNQTEERSSLRVAEEQEKSSVIVVRPANAGARHFASSEQAGKDKESDNPDTKQARDDEQAGKKESYLDAMEAAGFKNLTADELVAMKIQGVTPAYVKEFHDLGMKPTVEELIGMRVQGITPQYANDMRGLGLKYDPENLVGMKVQGITPEYVKGMQALGFKPDTEELIGMKVQGITPDYVKGMQATGLKPDVDNLIGMKVQGITPEYVKAMQEAGFRNVDVDELIGAKVQGVTPEFIDKARRHGFQNLTLDKLIALKQAGVL